MDLDTKELMMYALADAEKFWRHKRREVRNNQCTLYTEDECTERMKVYHEEYVRYTTNE